VKPGDLAYRKMPVGGEYVYFLVLIVFACPEFAETAYVSVRGRVNREIVNHESLLTLVDAHKLADYGEFLAVRFASIDFEVRQILERYRVFKGLPEGVS
jgi:hypothetical protein